MPTLDNPKHELFAQGVASGLSAFRAHQDAGFSPNRHNAWLLAQRPEVAGRIEELMEAGAARAEVEIADVVRELARIGFNDPREAAEWAMSAVTLKDSKSIPNHVAAAISEVRQTKDGVIVKFHDKNSALEKLGKYLGMFTEKHEHTSPDGSMSPQTVDAALVQALAAKLTG